MYNNPNACLGNEPERFGGLFGFVLPPSCGFGIWYSFLQGPVIGGLLCAEERYL